MTKAPPASCQAARRSNPASSGRSTGLLDMDGCRTRWTQRSSMASASHRNNAGLTDEPAPGRRPGAARKETGPRPQAETNRAVGRAAAAVSLMSARRSRSRSMIFL